jgi:hypothetical protein
VTLVLSGCGAQVVLEEDDGAGGSGTTTSTTGVTSTTKATTNVGSSSSGVVPCDEHADCGSNPGMDVCVFSGGFCAQTCGPASPPCMPGFTCDLCATASCPACKNCIGACIPQ